MKTRSYLLHLVVIVLVSAGVTLRYAQPPPKSLGDRLWKDKVVPYVISPNVFNQSLIESTINYFNTLSCVRWLPREPHHHKHYVSFDPATTCSSLIGRNQYDDHQSIFIGPECSSRPIILHEMYHVMGFYHEMRRFDRNKYIEVFWDNILPGFERYFEKLFPEETQFPHYPYDTSSIMHYGSFAYSKYPSLPTILQSPTGSIIKGIRSLSRMDVRKLNDLYRCEDGQQEGWSSWSTYSMCSSANCIKRRYKICSSGNNEDCTNEKIVYDELPCNEIECSVNGEWSRWASWSQCNVYCGNGRQSRQRLCNDPKPRGNGEYCHDDSQQIKRCRYGSCFKNSYDCEFDNDGWCSWKTKYGHWKIVSSSSPKLFGPNNDFSFGIGHYLFIEGGNTDSLTMIDLPTDKTCLSFYIQKTNHTEFAITGIARENKETTTMSFVISGNMISEWTNVKVSLDGTKFEQLQVIGSVKESSTKDQQFIAIDDVFFTKERCLQHVFKPALET